MMTLNKRQRCTRRRTGRSRHRGPLPCGALLVQPRRDGAYRWRPDPRPGVVPQVHELARQGGDKRHLAYARYGSRLGLARPRKIGTWRREQRFRKSLLLLREIGGRPSHRVGVDGTCGRGRGREGDEARAGGSFGAAEELEDQVGALPLRRMPASISPTSPAARARACGSVGSNIERRVAGWSSIQFSRMRRANSGVLILSPTTMAAVTTVRTRASHFSRLVGSSCRWRPCQGGSERLETTHLLPDLPIDQGVNLIGRRVGRTLLLTVLLVLCGCSTDGGENEPTSSPSATAVRGGTLELAMTSDFQAALDPAKEYEAVAAEFYRCCLLRTLLSYEGVPTAEGGSVLRPDIAAEIPTVSEDGLTWTFKIRPGIRYASAIRRRRGQCAGLRPRPRARRRPTLQCRWL